MNAIFFTQSSSLDLFFHVMHAIKETGSLERVGFYMADSRFFNDFKNTYPEIESGSYCLLKEWEIIAEAKDQKPDLALLRFFERTIGRPFLWNALVADRRIYYGKKYAYAKDYRPRFTHQEMLSILQTGLKRMESFFEEVEPDFITSFQCVTMGEYLSYLFASARRIPILNLRPTRIRNYIYAGEDILEPSVHLRESYKSFLKNGIDPHVKDEAIKCLKEIRETHGKYEGVVSASSRPPGMISGKREKISGMLRMKGLAGLIRGEFSYRFGKYKNDNHVSGYIGPLLANLITRPLRARIMNLSFNRSYVSSDDLSHLDYAFFPLHTEPEVTLSVYSKPYLNQIEAVRLISHNLPVGMKLVVKEHPWEIGKRSLRYYTKLLDVPNVLLAYPGLDSRELISKAKLVTVIAGSVGQEALMLGKPVIVLGGAPFNFLPASMVRHVKTPDSLGHEIKDLLRNYEYDEPAIISYIASIMKNSTPVDYYTRLLRRSGAYNPDLTGDRKQLEKERIEHIHRLAIYLQSRLMNFNRKNVSSDKPFKEAY